MVTARAGRYLWANVVARADGGILLQLSLEPSLGDGVLVDGVRRLHWSCHLTTTVKQTKL